jgi:Acyl-CoA reductase (LuxC)
MAEIATVGMDVLEGWQLHDTADRHRVRGFPPRMVHVTAGNSPFVAALTIARGALTKGVHLIKLPSNDLFTATAILRTMADIDPNHPLVRSFSAIYWRGGDQRIESNVYRAQYFDKVVAWGGEASMRHIQKYIGPGLELIAFDPKTSISLIGREAFASDTTLRDVAAKAALDVAAFNQDACACARFQFVEGTEEQVDRFCALLLESLGTESRYGDAISPLPPKSIRDEIDGLRMLEPLFRVFGEPNGRGIVIRSSEPVSFHPSGKTINVIPVKSLDEGVARANVATQTVGVYPSFRKRAVRDALATAGVQRVVPLGKANHVEAGGPHDAMYPLQRFLRWVSEEGEDD